MTTTEQNIEEMVRDFCSVTPKAKSEVRRRISEAIHQAEQEMNDTINEKVADERDKAEKHYQEEQDDYSQGYYMAMNTVMKFLSSLQSKPLAEEREREELDEKAKFTRNVSMLRQWLNEDRITESSKMVTNEELLHWFKDVE